MPAHSVIVFRFSSRVWLGSGGEGIDLPELITIQMNWNTFRFSSGSSATSLVMRRLSGCEGRGTDLTKLVTLSATYTSEDNECFGFPYSIVLESAGGCVE